LSPAHLFDSHRLGPATNVRAFFNRAGIAQPLKYFVTSRRPIAVNRPPSIPFNDLQAQYRRIKPVIEARMAQVLAHGRFILGPEVGELEVALASYSGVAHCIGVSNGTDALRMPLMARAIGPGDAVFLPAFTYTATAEVVVLTGAVPVFVDVSPDTYNIDPTALERSVARVRKDGALRPRAVIAVDLFGLPAAYPELSQLCRQEDLFLIADAAQAYGARQGNQRVGALAPVTTTSFFPAKTLGCYGDGGAIFTDDPELAEICRSIRFHGSGRDHYDIVRVGLNARLDTLQAAILLAKLEIFDWEIVERARIAARYDAAFASLARAGRVVPPPRAEGMIWAYYCMQIDGRDRVQGALKAAGIPTAVYYPAPLHYQSAYQRYDNGPGSHKVAEALCPRMLALPLHPYLDAATQDRIIDAFCAALLRAA
jgi:dTDP-4-amino-4,6-dideoxygalactose transaminase